MSKSEEVKAKEKKIGELSESIEFTDGDIGVKILRKQGVVMYTYDPVFEGRGTSVVPIEQTKFSEMDLDRLKETLDA